MSIEKNLFTNYKNLTLIYSFFENILWFLTVIRQDMSGAT